MPDTPQLFDGLTGRDYLSLCAEVRGVPLEELAARAEPLVAATRLAPDLDRRVGGYSFGTRKKIALVAALAFAPRVLLFDEAARLHRAAPARLVRARAAVSD